MIRHLLPVLGLVALHAHACQIKIAYNEIAAPPHYLGDGQAIPENPGISVELTDLAASRLGCKIRWLRLPIKRILRDLELNTIDATLALSYAAERTSFAVYPMRDGKPDSALAAWTSSYDFYVLPDSTLRWDGKQFNRTPRGVGANAGFSVVQDLARMGIAADEAQGDSNNFGKLVKGRIEVYAGQDLTLAQIRMQPEFKDIKKLEPSFVRKHYYLVFSRSYYGESADRVNQLWRQIARLRQTEGKRMERKYKGSY